MVRCKYHLIDIHYILIVCISAISIVVVPVVVVIVVGVFVGVVDATKWKIISNIKYLTSH